MNAINLDALGITKEEILNRAAEKAAADILGEDLYDYAENMLKKRINETVEKVLEDRIEKTLSEVMGRILEEEVTPRNIWGEKQGEPTTIKAALSERAREFWQVRVGNDGKPSQYGGQPRHEWLVQQTVKTEFEAAIKANINEVVDGFKQAMRKDAGQWISKYIGDVFPKQRR